MSSSVWDYRESHLRFFAEDVREGKPYEDQDVLGCPAARVMMADVLDLVADLLTELDRSFTGDHAPIDDEQTWMAAARARLCQVMGGHR